MGMHAVTLHSIKSFIKAMRIQVLSRLSTPYLTEAEEHRHAQLRKAEQSKEWRQQVRKRRVGIKNVTVTPFPELQSS